MTFVLGIDIGHSVVKLAHGEDTEGQPARAMIVTRSHADFGNRVLFDAAIPVLPGFGRPPAFIF